MKTLYRLLAWSAVLLPASLQAQTIAPNATTVLAPLAGPSSTPAAGQENIGFWGTDLGYTVRHNGNLRILFGDTHADENGTLIGWGQDDAQGTISLAAFPSGDAVDAYIASHPAPAGGPTWHGAAPPVTFRTNLFGMTASMSVLRNGTPLDMSAFRAPTGAFSNEGNGAFATFARNVQTQCSGGSNPTCSGGLTCDRGMGSCFPFVGGETSVACVLGTTSCLCVPVSGGGMCQDRSSSLYNTTESGRIAAIAMRNEVANASPLIDEVYYSKSWITNKFINSTVRTVNDFDPTRVNGVGNDYTFADGEWPTAREKVFLWGRPNFVGTNAANMSAKLYFAYVDMPQYSSSGNFAWVPKYFAGMNNGLPVFSTSQIDAKPLNLSSGGDGTLEQLDIVNQMSVSWVPSLNKWMMLYGGDLPPSVVQFFTGVNAPITARNPDGAIHARFASHPWGPWSAPVKALAAGDPAVSPPLEGTQYGSNGILYHPACSGATCVADASPAAGDFGRLYGANIVDAWTTPRANGAVDIYWNASTWNPYQVVLLRTRVTP